MKVCHTGDWCKMKCYGMYDYAHWVKLNDFAHRHNGFLISWSKLSNQVLQQREERAIMYANLSEPTMKIAELMENTPERFEIIRDGKSSTYLTDGRLSIGRKHKVVDRVLELDYCGWYGVNCDVFNRYELTYLNSFVKRLVDDYEKIQTALDYEEAEIQIRELEEDKKIKRQKLIEQYGDCSNGLQTN